MFWDPFCYQKVLTAQDMDDSRPLNVCCGIMDHTCLSKHSKSL